MNILWRQHKHIHSFYIKTFHKSLYNHINIVNFASKKHKRILKMAKGFYGRGKSNYSVARQRLEKSWLHAYKGRKLKKRNFRKGWIQRINAASRQHGLPYSHLIHGLSNSNIHLNRKILSILAVTEPFTFRGIIETVKDNQIKN